MVTRSALLLKLLTSQKHGSIVAAPTFGLPERLGGVRNWDYRYTWIRDAVFTLYAFMRLGYTGEAQRFMVWLSDRIAVDAKEGPLQIMYRANGDQNLDEITLDHLAGYRNSKPVRIGNAASNQLQLDIYGELMDAVYLATKYGNALSYDAWKQICRLIDWVATNWTRPDEGIWEVRGGRQHFVHSKVMAWVALDRVIKSAEHFRMEAPLAEWRRARTAIHDRVCQDGYDAELNSFTQAFGSKLLDASLLMIPLVGFLPPDDPRVRGTVAAVEKYLRKDGFVARYDTGRTDDGLPPGEGAFLPCTFWLADCYAQMGRRDEARELFERLTGLCNDVGLLAEEYDPVAKRLVGNFPQAFSHVGLVNTAFNLARPAECPAEQRKRA
jgi:GH15 family glucan-1,4-alpha-glucosidase